MKHLVAGLMLILAVGVCHADDDEIRKQLDELNAASMETFGISLAALSYLAEVAPIGYRPLYYLESTGKMTLIDELEDADYVEVALRKGLPGGGEDSKTFITVQPVRRGKVIHAYLQPEVPEQTTVRAGEPRLCNIGTMQTELGGTNWQMSSCPGGRSLVFATVEDNPAMPYFLVVQRNGEETKIHGEGDGDKTYTAAALEQLKSMSEADFDELVRQTTGNRNDSD